MHTGPQHIDMDLIGNERVDAAIGFIVDRMHVGQSYREVARNIHDRMKGKRVRRGTHPDRETRRKLIRQAWVRHAQNRDLYKTFRF